MKNLLLHKVQLVLNTIAESGTIAINELAEKLDIPLPTMSRLISDMTEMKLLDKTDYYHVALASGMIRLGECARKHSFLVKRVAPLLDRYAEKVQMNVLLAGFDANTMFTIYHRGKTENDNLIWECGLAQVLMDQAKLPQSECEELFRRNMPDFSDTARLIFAREMDSIRNERMLFRSNTMRQWSCAYGFEYRNFNYGFCFYGHAPECSRERFVLDCSMVLSRIISALNEE